MMKGPERAVGRARALCLALDLACALAAAVAPREAEARAETGPAEPARRVGWSLSLGAGVGQFASDGMEEVTDPGVAYDLRLHLGTERLVGVEAAYVGSVQDVGVPGGEGGAFVGSGIEGTVRLNLDRVPGASFGATLGGLRVSPFLFAGVGWSHWDLVNADATTASLLGATDAFVFPVGGGLSATSGRWVFEGRFTWREATGGDVMQPPTPDDLDDSLDAWRVTAAVGLRF